MNGIPHPSPIDDLPPMPHEKAVDLVCDEFEGRIRAGEQPRIEDYLPQLPESARQFGLRQLLVVELELRWKAGQSLDSDDYRRRFPEHLTVLEAELQRAEHEAAAVAPPSTDKLSVVDTQEFVATASRKVSEDDDPVCERLGRYQILRILGEGGFGRVYMAADTQLGRQVALKVPKKTFFDSGHSVAVFLDEARTAAKLKHAGLVTVHDVQQDDGRPFIVQEYIDGSNLHRWMREAGASHEQIVTLLIEIAEAVGFLHQQRLVHRDLKPGNILVDQQGHAHVADFGLAVHESSQWQRAGEVAGTWAYMSPEQLRGETHLLDGRSDLWSLGIILYELLVGRRPFPAINPQDLCDQIGSLEPRPPRQLVPDVSPELLNTRASDCVLRRCDGCRKYW